MRRPEEAVCGDLPLAVKRVLHRSRTVAVKGAHARARHTKQDSTALPRALVCGVAWPRGSAVQ